MFGSDRSWLSFLRESQPKRSMIKSIEYLQYCMLAFQENISTITATIHGTALLASVAHLLLGRLCSNYSDMA